MAEGRFKYSSGIPTHVLRKSPSWKYVYNWRLFESLCGIWRNIVRVWHVTKIREMRALDTNSSHCFSQLINFSLPYWYSQLAVQAPRNCLAGLMKVAVASSTIFCHWVYWKPERERKRDWERQLQCQVSYPKPIFGEAIWGLICNMFGYQLNILCSSIAQCKHVR